MEFERGMELIDKEHSVAKIKLALDRNGKPIEVKLPAGVTAKFVEWSMDDEIKYLESRDKVHRNFALIILALALGATLRFFLSL